MPDAAAVALLQLNQIPEAGTLLLPLLASFTVTAIVGFTSIRWLLRYLANHSFLSVSVYCAAIGVLVLLSK
jgi:undecaprenyl-diphosphatase